MRRDDWLPPRRGVNWAGIFWWLLVLAVVTIPPIEGVLHVLIRDR